MLLNNLAAAGAMLLLLGAEPMPALAETQAIDRTQQGEQQNGQQCDQQGDQQQNEVTGILKSVDITKNTITITVRPQGKDVERTYDLAKDVVVRVRGAASKLSDLKSGTNVTLTQSGDRKAIVKIRAGDQDNDGQQNQKDNIRKN